MKIIRIEHPSDNKGFWWSQTKDKYNCYVSRYKSHSNWCDIDRRHSNPNIFPTYSEDTELQGKIEFNKIKDYKFAFKSIEQLQIAFTAEELKEAINTLGFKILMLTVDDYFESPYQVVFKNPITTTDISELFI